MPGKFPVFSVSQVNNYVKDLMERDELLTGLLVRGEISNYKCYPSGHHYFSLKDAQGSIRCVMFRGDAIRLRFKPTNGMSIIAFGRVSVFPRDGQYQMYCTELIDDGQGALDRAFEVYLEKSEHHLAGIKEANEQAKRNQRGLDSIHITTALLQI